MRTFYLSFILLLCFACSQPTATDNTSDEPESEIDSPEQDDGSGNEQEEESVEPSSSDGPIVYITDDGDKYHTADCRYSKTAHAVKLSQAKADGKTACGVCKPNSKTGEKQVRCSGKTAEGKRCSRTTTDASGKCFQHRDS